LHNPLNVQILHQNGSKDSSDIPRSLGNLQTVRPQFCEQVHHFRTHFRSFLCFKNHFMPVLWLFLPLQT